MDTMWCESYTMSLSYVLYLQSNCNSLIQRPNETYITTVQIKTDQRTIKFSHAAQSLLRDGNATQMNLRQISDAARIWVESMRKQNLADDLTTDPPSRFLMAKTELCHRKSTAFDMLQQYVVKNLQQQKNTKQQKFED